MDCGLVPDERLEDFKWLKEANKKGGFLPINFQLSRLLDSLADSYLSEPSRVSHLKIARKAWESDVRERHAQSKVMLQSKVIRLEDENEKLQRKLTRAQKNSMEIPESRFGDLMAANYADARELAVRLRVAEPKMPKVPGERSNEEFLRQVKISISLSTLRRYLDDPSRPPASLSEGSYKEPGRLKKNELVQIRRSLAEGRSAAPEYGHIFDAGIELSSNSGDPKQSRVPERGRSGDLDRL
jgi:hypothetical protein